MNPSESTFRGHQILTAAVLLMLSYGCATMAPSQESLHSGEDNALLNGMDQAPDNTVSLTPIQTGEDFSWLMIFLEDNWALLMEDVHGRRTGYDPIADTSYRDIPNSSYGVRRTGSTTSDAYLENTRLEIKTPDNNDYALSIFGTVDTICSFAVDCYYHEPGSKPIETRFDNIPIAHGAVHSYTISLGSTLVLPYEVTGGFAGGTNEPVDVDRLLSYVSVAENITSLPTGTDKFNLVVIYSQIAAPETFAATLNGNNATSLFAPVDGGYEVVRIPLQAGENILILSIESLADGVAVTDTDSLIFRVD